MKILKRILIVFVALLIFTVVIGYVYLKATKTTYSGELKFSGLHSPVEVLYDTYGIPHIYAQNAEDAYYTLGYVHAQDRLFQMEMLRRAAAGRLSEVLGPDLLKTDKLFRTLGINKFAKEHAQKFFSTDTADFQRAALAYQGGINEFIRTGKTPLEFSIIGIPKTEFTPEDIYLAVGFMSFGFAEGIRADPVLEKVHSELGEAYLKDLAVQTPDDAVSIKSFSGQVKGATDPLITSLGEALEKIPVPLWTGSNGWVIDGSRTESGFPILANDTHIGFGQPAVWYEAHLEYPGFSFYGHHLAGVPFAMLGNNRYCGWGLTMFENDDTDFFKETVNPENPEQVKYMDQWETLTVRDEVIKVKGEKDVILSVKSSRHGPIINGIMEDVVPAAAPVSLWWMLSHIDNQSLQAAYTLNHAASFADAEKAASLFSSPGLNVMYGDVAGNIAWWAVAKLPIRPAHVNSKLFLDGSSGKDEYTGFYDFSKNPHALNPPWGYVYSANNQPDSVDGVLHPGYYFPRSRSGRIVSLISEDKKWNLEETKKVNLDVVSTMHRDVAKSLAKILQAGSQEEFKDLIPLLEGWNGDHQMPDVTPSVYYNLLAHVMLYTMKDELGAAGYKSLVGTSVMKNSYQAFVGNEKSPWWDDITTKDKKETRLDIVQKAGRRTLALLHETSGANPSDWTWGKIHTLTHKHPLGAVKPLDQFFNVGPFTAPGGDEVINNLHFPLDTTGYFGVTGGPALRKITDFGDLENGETVSPTGQSGDVMSDHYDDQAEMFVNGKFRKMLMNEEAIRSSSGNKLLLKPR